MLANLSPGNDAEELYDFHYFYLTFAKEVVEILAILTDKVADMNDNITQTVEDLEGEGVD